MRCILTNRTIGMTSFSIGTNRTIGTNGDPSYHLLITPMESICEYWTTPNKNGVIELARHNKSPWCLCSIPFPHDN